MVKCTACQKEIYTEIDGKTTQKTETISSSTLDTVDSLTKTTNNTIIDAGFYFCNEMCAPRMLRSNPPEKDPLQEAVEFFHQQNTEQSLEYYQKRGWSDELIDNLLLGWAPPDEHKVYNYLKQKGYSTAEILSTGLFTQNGTPPYECLWRGRYVFPYFNQGGDVVYAIARSTGSKGGGGAGYDGHPADILAGKYTKLAKNKPFSLYEEPIYGLHSIQSGVEDVILTEGMPDAISAINNGYTTFSPITTQFSHQQYEDVTERIENNKFKTVYIIPDNEEVQESQDSELSVGLEGGLKSAAHLLEREIEATIKIVELPRQKDQRKVDLADYLYTHSSDELDALLEKAKNPNDYEEFEEIRSTVKDQLEYRNQSQSSSGIEKTDGDYSAIYDLSVIDVLPDEFSRKGDRGTSPLGHLGDSRNYFSITSHQGDLLAHDFKRNVTYNALTYILCEIGERGPSNPTGPLSNEEIWLVWKWCKENNIIPKDDPVPSAAISHIAKEQYGSQPDDGYVPYDIYVKALKHIESTYGLSAGRNIPS